MKKEEEFLNDKCIGLVGLPRDEKSFGYAIYKELIAKGYDIYGVNPNLERNEQKKYYSNLSELNDKVKSIAIITNKKNTLSVVEEAHKLGIKNYWINQGSDTKETNEYCSKNNLNYISGKCILMYLEPVKSVHAFHRFFVKLFGKY